MPPLPVPMMIHSSLFSSEGCYNGYREKNGLFGEVIMVKATGKKATMVKDVVGRVSTAK